MPPEDEWLIDNVVRMHKSERGYSVTPEGHVFGVFPLTADGWRRSVSCFEATLKTKQMEFDNDLGNIGD